MFEKLTPEYQVNKRIRGFLLHCATQQGIAPETARLLFKSNTKNASVHLYDGSRHVKSLSFSGILEFFGRDYSDSYATAVNTYLHKVATDEQIALQYLHVVICEVRNNVGAYVYEGARYHKKIALLDLVIHFLQQQNE